MLWFVGIGISGFNSIPNESLEILAKADVVYMEQFTSPIDDTEIAKINDIVSGQFIPVKRWQVEDGTAILKSAKDTTAVLLSYGDPFIATTHAELRTRAAEQNIKTKCIHASSAVTAIIGECGLHFYKIGRQATIMNDAKSLTTPYYVIYRNMIHGNHTVLLLEYSQDKKFFLLPGDALDALVKTEKGQTRNVIKSDTYCIVASRIGLKDQSIVAGIISNLQEMNFGLPPHTIIIPGDMHFTESDALKISAKCIDIPIDNTSRFKSIPSQMLEKYVPMVREAIEEVRPHCKSAESLQILENADLYIKDAEKFLSDGQDEVAVLSIGYADGLIDFSDDYKWNWTKNVDM